MGDKSFFRNLRTFGASEIANILGATEVLNNKPVLIDDLAPLEKAGPNQLAYCETVQSGDIIASNAGVILIKASDAEKFRSEAVLICVKSPRAAFAEIATKIIVARCDEIFDTGTPICEDGVQIAKSANIANDVQIGLNSKIGHNVTIGPGVRIGRNCIIESGAVINCSFIGDNVRIGANSVIGKAGFGVTLGANGLIDVPQLGRVIIQDNVTIGALCTIDRGAFGDTIIGLNCKIDNHCHVAHNCHLGEAVIIAAFGGISGSVEVGNYVMMGGRVGVGDHFKIGEGAKLAAGAAVLSNVPAGQTFAGYPAKPKVTWMKESIAVSRLLSKTKK